MKLKGFGQLPSLLPSSVQCNNIFKIAFTFFLVKKVVLERVSEKVHATNVCIDCGEDEITRTASSLEGRLIREPAELT